MSESMEPQELRGTIDKYMRHCVMAFWGAPVETPDHAELLVLAALKMEREIERINADHIIYGLPVSGIGIGRHRVIMCVGDTGADIRRNYTVIGYAINLWLRLEGFSTHYGAAIIASEATRLLMPEVAWLALDFVPAKGKARWLYSLPSAGS